MISTILFIKESRESGLSNDDESEMDEAENYYARSPISPDIKQSRVNSGAKTKKVSISPDRTAKRPSSDELAKVIVMNSIKSKHI